MSLMELGYDDQDKDKQQTDDDLKDVVIEGDDAQDKDSGDDDDRRLVRGESGEDSEDRRQRNRDARLKRKERHRRLWAENQQLKQMVGGYQETIADLNKRLGTIEEGTIDGHGRRLEQSVAGAARALEAAKARLKKALADQDVDGVVEANEAIAQITVDQKTLREDLERFQSAREEERDKRKPNGHDEDEGGRDDRRIAFQQTVQKNVGIFQKRNSWYDHNSDDEDTQVVKRLDAEVAAEGYNPASRDYWQELEARMQEELPHRFKAAGKKNGKADSDDDDDGDAENKTEERRVITGGSGNKNGTNGAGYMLSKARVEAIKEAGKWDDPAERKKMIATYREYDRKHGIKGA